MTCYIVTSDDFPNSFYWGDENYLSCNTHANNADYSMTTEQKLT